MSQINQRSRHFDQIIISCSKSLYTVNELFKISLLMLYEWIKQGTTGKTEFIALTEECRKNRGNAKAIKERMLCVILSGVFTSPRKAENLVKESYTGLFQIDVDEKDNPHLANQEAKDSFREKLAKCKYTLLDFISPSGMPKAIFMTSREPGEFKAVYAAAEKFCLEELGVKLDPACNNLDRVMFVPYDPTVMLHQDFEYFDEIIGGERSITAPSSFAAPETNDLDLGKLKVIANLIEKSGVDITEDYKNAWVPLSRICALHGEDGRVIFHQISNAYPYYNQADCDKQFDRVMGQPCSYSLGTVIHLCRKHGLNISEVNSKATPASNLPVYDESQFEHIHTPTFDPAILKLAPKCVWDLIKDIKDQRKMDISFITLISILSGLFKELFIIHDNHRCNVNALNFIIGPPASGKGQMSLMALLFNLCELRLSEKYNDEMKAYNMLDEDQKKGIPAPVLKRIFIPANSSKAGLLDILDANEGWGAICESEADTLAEAMDQKWGGFSSLLRKTAENEPESVARKKGATVIEKLRFSLVMTGTPGQLPRIVNSAENGLMSRILFYCYFERPTFDGNVFNSEEIKAKNDLFESYKQFYVDLVMSSLEASTETTFSWQSAEHKARLNAYFTNKSEEIKSRFGDYGDAIVFRCAKYVSRYAAIFAKLRSYETNQQSQSPTEIIP